VIDALLSAEFPGKDALRMQMATALVRTLDEDGGLEISPAEESLPATVVYRVPVEAEAEDVDGMPIHVLLHVVDGRGRASWNYSERMERPFNGSHLPKTSGY